MAAPLVTRPLHTPVDQHRTIFPLDCSASCSRHCIKSQVARLKRLSLRTYLQGQALCVVPRYSASLPGKRVAIRSVMKESQPLQMGMRAPDFSVRHGAGWGHLTKVSRRLMRLSLLQLPEPLTGQVWSLDDFEGFSGLLVSAPLARLRLLSGHETLWI